MIDIWDITHNVYSRLSGSGSSMGVKHLHLLKFEYVIVPNFMYRNDLMNYN